MRKEKNVLVLENQEDKDLLFDLCDSYLFWINKESDDNKVNESMKIDVKVKIELINKQIRSTYNGFARMKNIMLAFANRDEFFIQLWDKILECFKLADLVKVGY